MLIGARPLTLHLSLSKLGLVMERQSIVDEYNNPEVLILTRAGSQRPNLAGSEHSEQTWYSLQSTTDSASRRSMPSHSTDITCHCESVDWNSHVLMHVHCSQSFCLLWNNFHKKYLLVLWESQLAWSRRVYFHKSQSILVNRIVSQQSKNPITHEETDPCKSVYTCTSIKLSMELVNECISDDQCFTPVKVLQNTNAPFPIQDELGLSQNKHTHISNKKKILEASRGTFIQSKCRKELRYSKLQKYFLKEPLHVQTMKF